LNLNTEIKGKNIIFNAEKVTTNPEVNIFNVNYFGNGIAILLNFDLNSAFNTSSFKDFDKFILDILEIAGIKKEIEVKNVNEERVVIRIRENPDFKILGILTPKEDTGKKIKVKFNEKYYVYKVDHGFFNEGNNIEEKIEEPFILYSLFKEKQEKPKIEIKNKNVKRGEKIELSSSSLKAGRIYRIRIYNKEGEIYKNVFQFENNILEIPVAYNEKSGNYTVEITDVATGLKDEINLKII
jgi:hypothetical protein